MCLTSLGTCIKNSSVGKVLIIQLLDKCLRNNKIAPLWYACLTSLSTCAKEVQFYCPSRTYAANPYCTIFQFITLLWSCQFFQLSGIGSNIIRQRIRGTELEKNYVENQVQYFPTKTSMQKAEKAAASQGSHSSTAIFGRTKIDWQVQESKLKGGLECHAKKDTWWPCD